MTYFKPMEPTADVNRTYEPKTKPLKRPDPPRQPDWLLLLIAGLLLLTLGIAGLLYVQTGPP